MKSDSEIISMISRRQRFMTLCNLLVTLSCIGIPLCPTIACFVWTEHLALGLFFLPLTVVCGFTVYFLGHYTNRLSDKIKELVGLHVTQPVLAEKIEITEYAPSHRINSDFVKSCSILPVCDQIQGSDYLSGTYKGMNFVYSDLHLEERYTKTEDGHRTTEYRTVFKGHIARMALGKPIDGYVCIRERQSPRRKKGLLSTILGTDTKSNAIETENEAFNNQFSVTTSDDQLAFYILTPQFMEHVIELDQKARGRTRIEFRGGYVTLTLDTGRDSFEFHKALNSKKRLENYRQSVRQELTRILDIFDEVLTKDNLF